MNKPFSESKNSGLCLSDCLSTISCHQTSFVPQETSWPVLLTTNTFLTFVEPLSASSTAPLSAKAAPLRYPPSAVITRVASASWILEKSASAEKPPKTT